MEILKVASPQEWEAARQRLLVKEKELTRARDALAAERRRMPWLAVEKEYEFEGPKGKAGLLDLFDGRKALTAEQILYRPGIPGGSKEGSLLPWGEVERIRNTEIHCMKRNAGHQISVLL